MKKTSRENVEIVDSEHFWFALKCYFQMQARIYFVLSFFVHSFVRLSGKKHEDYNEEERKSERFPCRMARVFMNKMYNCNSNAKVIF